MAQPTTIKNLLSLAALVGATSLATSAHAANTMATASATIIENLIITNQTPLNFGNISANGGGSVIVTPQNTRQINGGVTLNPGSFARATFNLQGSPNRQYFISTPSTLNFYANGNGTNAPLTVNNFQTFSTNASGNVSSSSLNNSGVDTIHLGGTLTVPGNASSGTYSGLVPLNVSY